MPGQTALWDDAQPSLLDVLAAPDAHTVTDPAGMEQPSMFEPVTDPPPFEACDECGLDVWQLHCDLCGDCYCDGDQCETHDPEE
jgi:hypothetical protein